MGLVQCAVERHSVVVVDLETGVRHVAYRDAQWISPPAIAPDDSAVAYGSRGIIYRSPLP